jgi:hypothetical protein
MTTPKYGVSDKSGSLSKSWKDRINYTDGLSGTSFYNTWRSIVFTDKGKRIGYERKWSKFLGFKEDMYSTYKDGLRISRNDKSKNFSKDNCSWIRPDSMQEWRLLKLEYNGEVRTIKEWCLQYGLNYNGVRQRHFKGKNYTPYEILFGKKIKAKRKLLDRKELPKLSLRIKASKMISAYRNRDKKKNRPLCNASIEWFIENILERNCVYCGSEKYVGGDRINNALSHIMENLVPACYRCNTMRGDKFTFEEMIKIGNFLRDNID